MINLLKLKLRWRAVTSPSYVYGIMKRGIPWLSRKIPAHSSPAGASWQRPLSLGALHLKDLWNFPVFHDPDVPDSAWPVFPISLPLLGRVEKRNRSDLRDASALDPIRPPACEPLAPACSLLCPSCRQLARVNPWPCLGVPRPCGCDRARACRSGTTPRSFNQRHRQPHSQAQAQAQVREMRSLCREDQAPGTTRFGFLSQLPSLPFPPSQLPFQTDSRSGDCSPGAPHISVAGCCSRRESSTQGTAGAARERLSLLASPLAEQPSVRQAQEWKCSCGGVDRACYGASAAPGA